MAFHASSKFHQIHFNGCFLPQVSSHVKKKTTNFEVFVAFFTHSKQQTAILQAQGYSNNASTSRPGEPE